MHVSINVSLAVNVLVLVLVSVCVWVCVCVCVCVCVRACVRECVRPSVRRPWHLLISRKPDHLEDWISACRQIERWAMLCWGQRPQSSPCARRTAENTIQQVCNISESGPYRGLNFGTQTDWPVGHSLLRLKPSGLCLAISACCALHYIEHYIEQTIGHVIPRSKSRAGAERKARWLSTKREHLKWRTRSVRNL